MSGRILIIDSLAVNRIILRVKLSAAFYEVFQAENARQAKRVLQNEQIDLIIASDGLTDVDFEGLQNTLRQGVKTRLMPPVVLIQKENDQASRTKALKKGAQAVLPRPVDELLLLAHIRSLLRNRDAELDLGLKAETAQDLGFEEPKVQFDHRQVIAVMRDKNQSDLKKSFAALDGETQFFRSDMLLRKAAKTTDLFVLFEDADQPGLGLSLMAELRSRTETRHAAILYIATETQRNAAIHALDLGANDVMIGLTDMAEMTVRMNALLERKALHDCLRTKVQTDLKAAIVDSLTGLYNRRYALPLMNRLLKAATATKMPLSAMIVDVDFFKKINDRFGHANGDRALVEVAKRLREHLSPQDVIARIGGEEFLVILPKTNMKRAIRSAERLRAGMNSGPIQLSEASAYVSLSIGVTTSLNAYGATATTVLEEADNALYAAKSTGRNKVVHAKAQGLGPYRSPFLPRDRNSETSSASRSA